MRRRRPLPRAPPGARPGAAGGGGRPRRRGGRHAREKDAAAAPGQGAHGGRERQLPLGGGGVRRDGTEEHRPRRGGWLAPAVHPAAVCQPRRHALQGVRRGRVGHVHAPRVAARSARHGGRAREERRRRRGGSQGSGEGRVRAHRAHLLLPRRRQQARRRRHDGGRRSRRRRWRRQRHRRNLVRGRRRGGNGPGRSGGARTAAEGGRAARTGAHQLHLSVAQSPARAPALQLRPHPGRQHGRLPRRRHQLPPRVCQNAQLRDRLCQLSLLRLSRKFARHRPVERTAHKTARLVTSPTARA
mmetsp:Transcript_30912/g.100631  ORF Transcript_30912/g.100631 Transcript_30912/m.100631 type:complete len:300 (+) Transcript_30912:416-1315(+)